MFTGQMTKCDKPEQQIMASGLSADRPQYRPGVGVGVNTPTLTRQLYNKLTNHRCWQRLLIAYSLRAVEC